MIPLSFLQSHAWERFQQALGRKTWRVNGILVIRHDLPMGFNYLYAPRPGGQIANSKWQMAFYDAARMTAEKEKSVFLKIDPLIPLSFDHTPYAIRHTPSVQPRETIIIDLRKQEDDILSAMHEKTRYNIRLAERKGVGIGRQEPSANSQGFDIFWRLLQETAARDGFRTHPKAYYEKLLAIRSDDFSNELFFAEYRGRVLAAALVNFFQVPSSKFQVPSDPVATYLHGASSSTHRAVMAPQLLHWRIMLEAKRRGCRAYDLWGIDEKRWPGLTRFKKGFGGAAVTYPPSVDAVYRPLHYRAYRLAKRIMRI